MSADVAKGVTMSMERVSSGGVESLLAQFGCEERDNKFQEHLAEQLLAAQQALAVSHGNVLQQMARKLDVMRSVEVENQLLNQRIAAIGGPSSSSSSYVKAHSKEVLFNLERTSMRDVDLNTSPPSQPVPPPPPPPATVPEGEPTAMGSFSPYDAPRDSVEMSAGVGDFPSPVTLGNSDKAADEPVDTSKSRGSVSSLASDEKGEARQDQEDDDDSAAGEEVDTFDQQRARVKSTVSWSPVLCTESSFRGYDSFFSDNCSGEESSRMSGLRVIKKSSTQPFTGSLKPEKKKQRNTEGGLMGRELTTDSCMSGVSAISGVLASRTPSQSYARYANARAGKFEVLAEWQIDDPEFVYRAMARLEGIGIKKVRSVKKDNTELIRMATKLQSGLLGDHERPDSQLRKRCRKAIIHPCGVKRAVWDVLSLLLVCYDLAVLPLQFFDPSPSTFSLTMAWITRVFWTIDMPMSLGTGYLLSDGSIQMNPREVAKRYFITWFGLDVLIVSLDWLEVVINSQASSDASDVARVGKVGRTFRIVRMVRLLRLVRMQEIIKLITFRIQSERLVIMADIAKILTIIIAVAHLMACVWYGICDESDPDNSWIGDAKVGDMQLEHKYLVSMHWAVSQFSGGMDEFKAKNFNERLYNVTVFLAAFMMAAVCVSGLTSSMTRLHILSSHQSRQLSTLRRYLIQNGISDRLALRVQRNALHAISEQQRLMAEKHVELLGAVSEPLRVELHFEMYSPVLEVHPFFHKYTEECPQVMMRVCHNSMSTLLVSYGDVIFNAGEIPENPKFYIVCNGQMEYIPNSGVVTVVSAEEWMSEGALWTHWMHRGILKAKSDGRLCLLDGKTFAQIVLQFDHPDFDPREYAIEYVKMLNEMQEDKIVITDLKCDHQEELVQEGGSANLNLGARARTMLTNFGGGGRNMMDAPRRRESVLFTPSKTTKLARANSKTRMIK